MSKMNPFRRAQESREDHEKRIKDGLRQAADEASLPPDDDDDTPQESDETPSP